MAAKEVPVEKYNPGAERHNLFEWKCDSQQAHTRHADTWHRLMSAFFLAARQAVIS
jgi:hypothetical protein